MNLTQHMLVAGLRVYQHTISPLQGFVFGPLARCRFQPSCSQYAIDAIQEHGALRGSWLAVKRLARCHPWGGSGWDPVPRKHPEGAPHVEHEEDALSLLAAPLHRGQA